MKKVLVTGGSHAEIPLIKELKSLGYYVITTGNNEDGIGHKYADFYDKGDFSDVDVVYEIAQKNNVCAIVSGCNDFAYLSTSYVCEKLGFPGHDSYENAKIIHHKDSFRHIIKECGLPCPENRKVKNKDDLKKVIQDLRFPLFFKPIDLTGGKGVTKCNDYSQIENAYVLAKSLTKEDYIIVEEAIKGTNHGVSVLLYDGKVKFAFFDNEEYFLNRYLVSGAYSHSDISKQNRDDIICQIEKMAGYVKLVNGLFHCQCIITNDGMPYLIDPCRRAPGDLYIKLVEYATGIPYSRAIVKSELGMDYSKELEAVNKKEKYIARECIMTNRNGIISRINISSELEQYIKDKVIWAEKGQRIEDYMKYKAGIVFFEFPNKSLMLKSLDNLYGKMVIEVE